MLQYNNDRMKAFIRASTFNNDCQIVELVNYGLDGTFFSQQRHLRVLKKVI